MYIIIWDCLWLVSPDFQLNQKPLKDLPIIININSNVKDYKNIFFFFIIVFFYPCKTEKLYYTCKRSVNIIMGKTSIKYNCQIIIAS